MIDNIHGEPKKRPLHLIVFPSSTTTPKVATRHSHSVEIRKVGHGVFEYRTSKLGNESYTFGDQCIVLRKTRDIAQSRVASARTSLGNVYTLVTYRFAQPDAQVRKKVQRLIRRSLSIRFRPGALLFPYLRARDGRRLIKPEEKERLHTSRSLSNCLTSLGAEVHRWGRLEPRREKDRDSIQRAIGEAITADLSSIQSKVVALRLVIQNHNVPKKRLWDRLGELNNEYRLLKMRLAALERIWRLDVNRSMKRVYNALLKARRELANKETEFMIQRTRGVSVGPV
jgi:hypothetical protein